MLDAVQLLSLLALFTLSTAAGSPGKCTHRHLDHKLKGTILKWHNDLRNDVASGKYEGQKPASNMKELVWSKTLAKRAQKWAKACKSSQHDPKLYTIKQGQNIGSTSSPTEKVTDEVLSAEIITVMELWAAEVKRFKGTSENAGHYTQVVWAKTSQVGCGAVRQNDGQYIWTHLVCNYKKAGNMKGKKPYHTGKPNCKKQKMKTSSNYKSLCVELNEKKSRSLRNGKVATIKSNQTKKKDKKKINKKVTTYNLKIDCPPISM